ncbi:hypothetical protein Raf01_38750 [Rugosimonospora africana]|uniref:HTH luxR-type domain-containing protein n=2 Tax=Rugosimonospora africana TaxID=556532 RepID=A0A8J3VRS7_9ACTN|nr:hypothetical protein Raf01_38750 [Rugosimonospora africana]
MIRLVTAGRPPAGFARVCGDHGLVCLGGVDRASDLDRPAAEHPDALVCFAGDSGTDLVRLIRDVAGRCYTVVVGRRDWPESHAVIRAGANAYLVPRYPDDYSGLMAMLTAAVPVLPACPPGRWGLLNTLSEREREALAYVAAGYTHQQTASRMRVAKSTVDTFIARIRTKLGVGNKAELTALALLQQPVDRARTSPHPDEEPRIATPAGW